MTTHLVFLAAGVAAAAFGGSLFVRGVITMAARLRVSPVLVGTTVAALATSAPELSVGLQAAAAGQPQLALGDALGSNVVNITVVLGTLVAAGTLRASRRDLRRDLLVAAAAPIATLIALVDGRLVRAEAALLLALFAGWVAAVARSAIAGRAAEATTPPERVGSAGVLAMIVGLITLVVAGRLVVIAAEGIGETLDLDSYVVGATMVALGTSTPEIATAIAAARRGRAEVGVGTVLGSNVFNNLWIVGVAALISPIASSVTETIIAVAACLLSLAIVTPPRVGGLSRTRGAALLALFAAYAVATVAFGTSAAG